jgi:nickel/cobalt exporter
VSDHALLVLLATAASIGVVHTLLGPDHYLPFVALGRARGWSLRRTLGLTLICGIGHVASSVALGAVGLGLGVAVTRLEVVEGHRASLATWALIAFGLVYAVWGVRRGLRRRGHGHLPLPGAAAAHRRLHRQEAGATDSHEAAHRAGVPHSHTPGERGGLTPWVLFVVFVLGPCEPLIPLLMAPALAHGWWGAAAVTVVFAVATLATMALVVAALAAGAQRLPLAGVERWSHALAGATLLACGLALELLGL